MAEPTQPGEGAVEAAYQEGRRAGIAMAALAVGVVAFVSLLGLEKAILALVLGFLGRKGLAPGTRGRQLANAALVVAFCFVIVWVGFMTFFVLTGGAAKFIELMKQLR